MVKFICMLSCLFLLIGCQNTNYYNVNYQAAALNNVQLGLLYFKRGQVPRAKYKLLMALKQAPELPEVYLAMGYFLSHTGENVRADNFYKKALVLAPGSGQVQHEYGVYLCDKREYKQALYYLLLAAKNPNYLNTGQAYSNASICAGKEGDEVLSERYAQRAALL